MSDERLRELERRVRAGEREARVEWLRERVRAGQLDPERLALAARCGDADARAVAGEEEASPLPARDLAAELLAGGRDASLRAALGLALHPQNLTALAQYVAKLYARALKSALQVAEQPADGEARRRAASDARVEPELTSSRWTTHSREGLYALAAAATAGAADAAAARQALFAHLHAAIDPAKVPDHPDPYQARWTPLDESDEARALLLRGLDSRPDLLAPLCAGLGSWALGDPPPHRSDALEADLAALKR